MGVEQAYAVLEGARGFQYWKRRRECGRSLVKDYCLGNMGKRGLGRRERERERGLGRRREA